MVSYIFGGEGLPKTPQELARLRAVAQAMAPSKAPQNVGEGLSSIGNAIAYRMMMAKADKGEAMGRNTASNAFSALMNGMGGGTPPASSSVSNSTPAPSMAATPSNQPPVPGIQPQPQAGGADYIRQGLVKRGLPEHVADAFVVNFQDESGLNPGINEANPIVPGSRGGYGLYQLTGPRRVAYEAFAKERGVSPDNVDAQLDFLMMEGQGSEKAAFDKILASPDKATAAQTIVRDFLRPSPEYRDSRMAKYASLASPQAGGSVDAVNAMAQGGQMPMPEASAYVDPMVSAPNSRAPVAQALARTQPQQPMQPVEVAGGTGRQGIMAALMGGQPQAQDMPTDYFPAAPSAPGATSPSRQQIMQVLTNQFATPEQKAIATDMYQQMQQSQDPMRQLEMQKMRLELQQMQNPQPGFQTLTDEEEKAMGLDPSGIYQKGRDGKLISVQEPAKAPTPTDDMREYDLAKTQGYTGSFADYQREMKKAGSQTINLGGGDNKQVFDAMMESATSARSAVTGLNSLREAKAAVEGGIISGAGADARLGLQKLGALLGVANPDVIQNTETFRAAIAPQVAAMMKATVGSTQISNADREFAERAAGGSINLDEGTIRRLVDIMERGGAATVQGHMDRLNKVYPEGGQFDRERALFGVALPEMAPAAAAPAAGGVAPGTIEDGFRFKGGDPADERNWEKVQ